jgi:hypothetical protein
MSCNIERSVELPAPPEEVWEALPELFGDDEERVRVVDESDVPRRWSFWWATLDGDEPPSYVEIDLAATAIGTLLHVRETRLDGGELERCAFDACAYAA